MNEKSLRNLYFAFINSYTSYGNIVWGSTCKTKLKKINSTIKHACRIILNKDRMEHSEPLMNSLNILDIYKTNLFKISQLMYDVKRNATPEIMTNKFSKIDHDYPTQYSLENYKLPKIKVNLTKFSIRYRGPYVWNNIIPLELKNSETKLNFKNHLKKLLLKEKNPIRFF